MMYVCVWGEKKKRIQFSVERLSLSTSWSDLLASRGITASLAPLGGETDFL